MQIKRHKNYEVNGDAAAAKLYSQAFAQEPQFYSFIRSLKAYESSFEGSDNMMILKPDSDFFRFMQAPKEINKR